MFNKNEVKGYFSIILSFVMLLLFFQNTISFSFADSCDDLPERGSLDRCRYGKDVYTKGHRRSDFNFDGTEIGRYSNETGKSNGNGYKVGDIYSELDGKGNQTYYDQPVSCLDPQLDYEPFTSPDYFYQSNNKYCLFWSLLETQIPFYTTMLTMANICKVLPAFTCGAIAVDANIDAVQDMTWLQNFISKVKNLIDKMRKVIAVIKTIVGVVVSVATTAALGAMTDPLIVMMVEAVVYAAEFTFKLIKNLIYNSRAVAAIAAEPNCAGDVPRYTAMAGTCGAALATSVALPLTLIYSTTAIIWSLAKKSINRVKICGDKWNGFAYTSAMMEEARDGDDEHRERYYPEYGAFSNSYEFCLNKYVNNEGSSAFCDEMLNVGKICDYSSEVCNDISRDTKSNYNRLYRERTYGGMEYSVRDYSCRDPRLNSVKGYRDATYQFQRYYFRGNEAAQYACGRFKYRANGCNINGKEYSKQDVARDQNKNTECEIAFEEAYRCCQEKRLNGVCLYDADSDQKKRESTFCLYDDTGKEIECSVDLGGALDPKMAVYIPENNESLLCVKNVDYCPYAYNVGGGTTYREEYCNGIEGCKNPFDINSDGICGDGKEHDLCKKCSVVNSGEPWGEEGEILVCKKGTGCLAGNVYEDYDDCMEWDKRYGSDYSKIWIYNTIYNPEAGKTNAPRPTAANGNPKNFCQLNRHCTERGLDTDFDDDPFEDNLYIPQVCKDFIGDSQNLPTDIVFGDLDNMSVLSSINNSCKNLSRDACKFENPFDINNDTNCGNICELDECYPKINNGSPVIYPRTSDGLTVNANGSYSMCSGAVSNGSPFDSDSIFCAKPLEIRDKCESYYNGEVVSGAKKTIGKIINVDFNLGSYRGFTAPLAQCVKETLSNIFLNIAGRSVCMPGYAVNEEGLCGADTCETDTGECIIHDNYYEYKIGQQLSADHSIFYWVQYVMRNIILTGLSLLLAIVGLKFLMGGGEGLEILGKEKDAKAVVLAAFKLAIVLYFSIGEAWQSRFYVWLSDFAQDLYATITRYAFSIQYEEQERMCRPTIKIYDCNPFNLINNAKTPILDEYGDDVACKCWKDIVNGGAGALNEVYKLYGPETANCKGCYNYAPKEVKKCRVKNRTDSIGDFIEYVYTGSYQVFNPSSHNIKAGDKILLEVYGAQGGGGDGGAGGYSTAVYTVRDPNVPLHIYVGGAGGNGTGGWGGGGRGYNSGGGGGGASDIRTGGTALSNRVIVAGGGGGTSKSGSSRFGGSGGGGNSNGGNGSTTVGSNEGGSCTITSAIGGSDSAGGIGSRCYANNGKTHDVNGCNGGSGIGGNANCNYGYNSQAGGGGGGWYGGGGGSGFYSTGSTGGGGGSGYCSTSLLDECGGGNGKNVGDGRVMITWGIDELKDIYIANVSCDCYAETNGGKTVYKPVQITQICKPDYIYAPSPSGASAPSANREHVTEMVNIDTDLSYPCEMLFNRDLVADGDYALT
ncbi:MAG: hypothetical protein LBH46_03945, partial [Rickettsiales bacterium]|nr:hypothetical protein [Rickettsiales bacterium]